MAYECRIAADSLSPAGTRATTFIITFPRIVLAEFNTHRVFSRNSASSRAVPVDKIIEKVLGDPFMPVWWGKNQSGMQAREELDGLRTRTAKEEWLAARDDAVFRVRSLQIIGLHKQICNRLLEPWMWTTVVVTSTEYENFFKQRCHPDAQPEIRVIAEMMRNAYRASKPVQLKVGGWHVPLANDIETINEVARWCRENEDTRSDDFDLVRAKVSASRCAAASYYRLDEKKSVEGELERFARLTERMNSDEPKHLSPLEHPMQALATPEKIGNVEGFLQLRKMYAGESGRSVA